MVLIYQVFQTMSEKVFPTSNDFLPNGSSLLSCWTEWNTNCLVKIICFFFHAEAIRLFFLKSWSRHQGYVTNGWNVLAVSIQDTPPFSPYMVSCWTLQYWGTKESKQGSNHQTENREYLNNFWTHFKAVFSKFPWVITLSTTKFHFYPNEGLFSPCFYLKSWVIQVLQAVKVQNWISREYSLNAKTVYVKAIKFSNHSNSSKYCINTLD